MPFQKLFKIAYAEIPIHRLTKFSSYILKVQPTIWIVLLTNRIHQEIGHPPQTFIP